MADTHAGLTFAIVIALSVSVIDAPTSLDFSVTVLYVAAVLLVASTGKRLPIFKAACGCVALTLLGFAISADNPHSVGTIAPRVVGLLAIAATAVLALRNQAATATLQEQVDLLNLADDAIVVHDMDDRVTYWNYGARALYGWTREQALGQSLQKMTQSSFPMPYEEVLAELLTLDRWHGELQCVRNDGSVVLVSSRATLLRDAKGKPRAILVCSNDITAREREQHALERSEALLRDAQRLSGTASIAVRFPGGEMWWSDEVYRIFDYPRETVPSLEAVLAKTYPDDRALVRGVLERGGEPGVDIEYRLALEDASINTGSLWRTLVSSMCTMSPILWRRVRAASNTSAR